MAGPRIDHTLSVIERAASLSRNVAEEREPFVAFFPPFLFFLSSCQRGHGSSPTAVCSAVYLSVLRIGMNKKEINKQQI